MKGGGGVDLSMEFDRMFSRRFVCFSQGSVCPSTHSMGAAFAAIGRPDVAVYEKKQLRRWAVQFMLAVLVVGSVVGKVMPDQGKERQAVPGWLLLFVGSVLPIILDCCQSSQKCARCRHITMVFTLPD